MHSSWGDQREEARGSDVSMHSLWGDQRKEERGSKVSTAEISISRHHSSSIEVSANIAAVSIRRHRSSFRRQKETYELGEGGSP